MNLVNISFIVDKLQKAFEQIAISDDTPVQKLLPANQETSPVLSIPEIFFRICEQCETSALSQLASCSKRSRLFISQHIAAQPNRIETICSKIIASDKKNIKTFYSFCQLSGILACEPLTLHIPCDYDTNERTINSIVQTQQLFNNITTLVFESDYFIKESDNLYGIKESDNKINNKNFSRVSAARKKIIDACQNVQTVIIRKSTIDLEVLPEQVKSVVFSECVVVPKNRMMDIWRATANCDQVSFSLTQKNRLPKLESAFFSLPERDPWSDYIRLQRESDPYQQDAEQQELIYKQKPRVVQA